MSTFEPRRFGTYILTDVLGEGGAGRVFQGYRSSTDIKVPYAIKILLEKNLSSLRYLTQFREEALLASRLKHANIGSFIEFFEFHGQNAIVLEFIEGVGLNRLIGDKGKRMDLHHALFLGNQILEGLSYLQRNNVIHGDLSPGNVMIDREGQAKLIDFGLSKLQKEVESPSSKIVQASLGYMSPQRLFQRKVSASDDLFAFGIILWELLTGERYHTDRSFVAICRSLENFTPRDPKSVVPDIPVDVARFVVGCLNAENATGFKSVNEAREEMKAVLARNSIFPDIDKFRSYMHERFGQEFHELETKSREHGEISARASKDERTQVLTADDVNAPLTGQTATAVDKSSSREITQSSKSGKIPGTPRLSTTRSVEIPLPPKKSSLNVNVVVTFATVAIVVFTFVIVQSRKSAATRESMEESVAAEVVKTEESVKPLVSRGSRALEIIEEKLEPAAPAPTAATPEEKEVVVSSSPPGAVVYRDRVMVGTTPLQLPAHANIAEFAFRKEGFGDIFVQVPADIRSISVDLESRSYATEKFQ